MIDTNKLKGIIVEAGMSQNKVAELIGVTPKTFYQKMNKGVFGSDEIEIMIKELNIDNPMEVFFANKELRYARRTNQKETTRTG